MTTREILAEIDMAGLHVVVIRVMEAGNAWAWGAVISPAGSAGQFAQYTGPSFDAALLSAWNAHTARVAA